MIPDFVTVTGAAWRILPPGVHSATIDEVRARYSYNPKRERLLSGFCRGAHHLFQCGCRHLYLDGGFVTEKPNPSDYDSCWPEAGVNVGLLDLVLRDFSDERRAQKEKYFGEFLPASFFDARTGTSFLEFFQQDKDTGAAKGILRIENWIT